MSVTVTLQFPTIEAASAALAVLAPSAATAALVDPAPRYIAPEDRPDAGVEVVPAAPVVANPFAGQGAILGTVDVKPFDVPNFAIAPEVAAVPAHPPVQSQPGASTAPSAATVPTAAPVAAPSAPAPFVPPSGIEVDVTGVPWDQRIHASTKTKTDDGRWRQRRGLNDLALKERVEAELRAAMSARAPVAAVPPLAAAPSDASTPVTAASPGTAYSAPAVSLPPAAPTAAIPPATPSVPTPPMTPAAPISAVPALAPITAPSPAVSAAPPAIPAPAPATGETFGQLMARLAPAIPASLPTINASLAAFGLQSLAQLAARPDLVAPFAAHVDAALAAVPAAA